MSRPGWAHRLPDVALTLDCSGQAHLLRWSGGRVRAEGHPDLAAEEALAAFGGELPACVDAVRRWRQAVADGGFLLDWCDTDLDDVVYRHHLRVALNRLRAEGVQDLLRGIPPRRAEAMGQFLLRFPQPWVDRAALAVVRRGRGSAVEVRLAQAIDRAVQVRARSAFVRSLARWSAVVRPAALVRFDCVVVGWDQPAEVRGELDGTASWCRVALSPRWLVEAWGDRAGLDEAGDLALTDRQVLHWRPGPTGRLTAIVQQPPG